MLKKILLFLAPSVFLSVLAFGSVTGTNPPVTNGGIFTGAVTLNDDVPLNFGTGAPMICQWETADANANAFVCALPEGGAVDVPAFVIGDATILNVDLGFLNGFQSPALIMVSDDGLSASSFGHNNTNTFVGSTSGGVNFTPANGRTTLVAIAGQDPAHILTDGDVAHGMTTIFPSTSTVGTVSTVSAADGGLNIIGASDASSIGLELFGVIGVADPNDDEAATYIGCGKKNVATIQALGADETCVQVNNLSTNLLRIRGDGDSIFAGTVTATGATFSAAVASDVSISFLDGDVANGVTDFVPTTAYGLFNPATSTNGGFQIIGLSEGDNIGVNISGFIGSEDPDDTREAIALQGAKRNGTSLQALGTAETLLAVSNLGSDRLVLRGNGDLEINGTLRSSATTTLGWSVVTGANTACNTTCTSACAFGQDTAALTYAVVDCADATADRCLCAGAN